MQTQLIFATVLLAIAGSTQQVDAYGKYVKLIPNGAAVPNAPAVGHVDAEGAEGVNDFGKAFKKAGNAWTKELCMADTDGDGFTNGQELGDPCCTWTSTSTAGLITDGISHPSDKTKTPSNAKLIAGCSTATTAGSTTAAATTNATTTAKPKETVTDVLAPVSATASPNASTATSIDDFADSSSNSSMSSMTPTPTATKKNSTASSTNTTSGAASTTGTYGASSLAATVAVVCASALLSAF